MESIRRRVENKIIQLTGTSGKEREYLFRGHEGGFFAPDAAICQVHGDFPSMLCGGISALLLQMLHPKALAGIYEHSTFREDIFGRLRRTSQFILTTTFGTRIAAEHLIARVNTIHAGIKGVTPDGLPYNASDPELLTWIHVAECSSFMASHLRFRRKITSEERQTEYYRESAVIAAKLGARNIPVTPAEVTEYFQDIRPQLRCDERTREVARIVLNTTLPDCASLWIGRMMMRAGIDLLPCWAGEILGLRAGPVFRMMTQPGIHFVASGLRACMRRGSLPHR
ncbi:oxygenase MpaB family protein [Enterobacter mori]